MIILILCTLPFISAKITINVKVNTNSSDVAFNFSGTDIRPVITNKDFYAFNISFEKLSHGVLLDLGRAPDEIFLTDPTEYGDLYKTFKWQPVKRYLKINKATVMDILNEDILLETHEVINNTTEIMKTKRELYTTVENTAQSTWLKGRMPNEDVYSSFDFDLAYGRFKYVNKWRNTSLHVAKMPIGVTEKGEISIKPFNIVATNLTVTRTILIIELEYKAELNGIMVLNYATRYGSHHFWAPSIGSIMKASNMSNEVYTKERVEVRCYINPRLNIYDKLTGETIELMKKRRRPLMRILRSDNASRILYTRMKQPKQEKKKEINI